VERCGVILGVRRSWLYPLADARGCIEWGWDRDDAGNRPRRTREARSRFEVDGKGEVIKGVGARALIGKAGFPALTHGAPPDSGRLDLAEVFRVQSGRAWRLRL
jgi:hypothetical protein